MAAYTDATKIAAFLGVTLTAPQITQAGINAQAASDWIDQYKRRSWQASSPVSGEIQTVMGDLVFLDYRPVLSIASVEVSQAPTSASWVTLAASQYELIDGAAGKLWLSGWGNYLVRVAYAHDATTPPPIIALAATMIAASWLQPTLAPQTAGLESVALGQNDVNVKFSKDRGDVPDEALRLLGARPVVIA